MYVHHYLGVCCYVLCLTHALVPLAPEDSSALFRGVRTCLARETPGYVFAGEGEASGDAAGRFLEGYSGPVVVFSASFPAENLNAKSLAFFVETPSSLNSTLSGAMRRRIWDVETCVAFVVCAPVDDVSWLNYTLESFWNSRVLNFVIIFGHDGRVEAATFNPFGPEKFSLGPQNVYFPDKLRNMWGHPLNVTTFINPPLSDFKGGRAYGTDVSVLLAILERMNATINYSLKTVHQDTDFIFSSSVMNNVSYNSTNHLYPFKMDDVVILVPKGGLIASYQCISRVFTSTVWFLILTSFLAVVALSVAINSLLRRNEGPVAVFLNATRLLFASPILLNKFLPPVKAIFILWAYLCLILTTAFGSILTSVLITPKYNKEINTIQELIQSDLGVILDRYFVNAQEEQLGDIKGRVIVTLKAEVVKSLYKREKSLAHVLPSSSVYESKVLVQGGERIYHVMRQHLIPTLRTYNVKGNHLYVNKMNEILLQLLANGVIGYIEASNSEPSATNAKLNKPEVFNLAHLSFAFIFLMVGFFISFVAFTIEKCVHRPKYH